MMSLPPPLVTNPKCLMLVHDIVAALERLQFRNGFRLGGYVMPITKIRWLGTKHRQGCF